MNNAQNEQTYNGHGGNVDEQSAAHEEGLLIKITGTYRDVIIRRNPDGTISLVEDTGWRNNLVVDVASNLLAGWGAKDATFTDMGILYHTIGSGNVSWDTTPVSPSGGQTTLTAEFFRKAPDYVIFIDPITNNPLAPGVYSGKIETRTTFLFTDCPPAGTWIREHGLFGGDATSTLDTGTLFNVVHHPKIWKDEFIQITRYFRHEFTIV